MENAAEVQTAELAAWMGESFSAGLAATLETMTGERPQVEVRPPEGAAPGGELLWWEQPFDLGTGAAAWIGAGRETWLALGSHVLRAAGIDASEPADARNTYLELVSQGAAGLAKEMGARLSARVSPQEGKEAPAPAEATQGFDVHVAAGGSAYPPLWFRFGAGLRDVFEKGMVKTSGGEVEVAERAAGAPPEVQAADEPAPGSTPKAFNLLMEVELPVSVSFGRAQLPLKDVLKLTTGSIVELNRAISEPVEVIVNNCVIARGEVVVIDGNYGVRIQEIISREKRLGTLS